MSASSRRLRVLRAVILALVLTLLGRLWQIQLVNGQAYAAKAATERYRDQLVPATRGQILDAEGQPLATNNVELTVTVNPTKLGNQPDGGSQTLARLARLLSTTVPALQDHLRVCSAKVGQPCWNGSPYQPIPVATGVNPRVALQIMELPTQYPAVAVQPTAVRSYPPATSTAAAQLVGYLGPLTQADLASPRYRNDLSTDLIGRDGLEASYDAALRGKDGVTKLAVNHLGQPVRVVSQTPPTPGDTLATSIVGPLQQAVEQAITTAATSAGPQATASGVVLDARTGRVMAMANYPSYNPNEWNGGAGISLANYQALVNGPGHPLINDAIGGEWAPGSTFKVISASAAVTDDGDSINGLYDCPSTVDIDGLVLSNNGEPNYGAITLAQSLIQSCDTVFYNLGQQEYYADQARIARGLPPQENTLHMAQHYGLGQPTGVDLPGESPGRLVGRAGLVAEWKANKANWCAGAKRRTPGTYLQRLDAEDCADGYQFTPAFAAEFEFGQFQTAVTPIQMACVYAAIANGGTVFSPRVGEKLIAPDGEVAQEITPPVRGHLPVAPATLAYLRNALSGVTADPSGTAYGSYLGFPLSQVPVAGKTGTAQVQGKLSTSWFDSFAPANNPKYVVVVVVGNSGYGATYAAPATRAIYDSLFGLEGHPKLVP